MATAPVDICIVGRSRFDCDNLATLLRRHGGSPDVCIGAEDLRARAAEHGTAALVLVEAGGAAETDLLAAVDICGAAPIYAFGRDAARVSPDRLLDLGVRDFLRLPLDERLAAELVASVRALDVEIVHRHPAMVGLVALARRVGASDAPILVVGETGTGKEVIAREIHTHGRRKAGPFVAVNCAAIPDHLLESELFGHEKGAFTGAVARRIGKFEEASGGTLLLDEIGEMDLRLQAKLLRAIQEKQIDRIGARSPVRIDLRIVATTNRDLAREVVERRFREDLYYRLNVINLAVPPLRDRREDIEALAGHFCRKYCAKNDLPEKRVAPGSLAKLLAYDWPGNVRELENTVYRAVLIASGGTVEADDIIFTGEQRAAFAHRALADLAADAPEPVLAEVADGKSATTPAIGSETGESSEAAGASAAIDAFVGRSIAEVEEHLIKATLEHCYGNRTRAATILGISIQTLRNKLERYVQ